MPDSTAASTGAGRCAELYFARNRITGGNWQGFREGFTTDGTGGGEPGIGSAKAAQIKAAVELGRRLAGVSGEDRPAIHSPEDAANLLLYEMGALEQEELRVILLDTRNRVVKIFSLYKGSTNSSQVRIAELFKEAIRANSVSVILVHNHPSGDPTPSPDDVVITQAAVSAGKRLDIDVLDHIVIGKYRWVSLKERGLGFGAR